jgi:hypothetical protein
MIREKNIDYDIDSSIVEKNSLVSCNIAYMQYFHKEGVSKK